MNTSPYVVSNWVEGEQFYGRELLCHSLTTAPDRCLYLMGTRRIGKTSLLKRLADLLSPNAVYCDLMQAAGQHGDQAVLDEERLVRRLQRELARQAEHSAALRASQAAWSQPAASLVAWLEEASWTWEEHGLTLTLLWDEAEMLRRLPVPTLMQLRALLQHSNSLRLIICASKGLAALNDHWRAEGVSPFLFGFRTAYIAGLTDQEATELITQRGQVQVADATAARLRELTGNHPFLLQTLCDRLYQAGTLRAPTSRDVLVHPAMADLFRIDVAALSPGEQAVLHALAQRGACQHADLLQRTGLSEDAVQSFGQGMLNLGYLRAGADGSWTVGNEFLVRWLRSMPPDAASAVTDQASLEVTDEELQRLELARATRRRREQELQAQAEAPPGAVPSPNHAVELAALRAEIAALEQQVVARKQQTTPLPVLAEPLSEREREVLRLLAQGLRNPEIARRLTVSDNTVKAHVKRIYRKLDVHDRIQAITRARELGLVVSHSPGGG
jgi:DNA-binding CsgD family transcriptional regulator